MAITIELKRSTRSIARLSLLGVLFFLCALAMIVKAAVDAYQENKHAKWPSAVGTIVAQSVRKIPPGSHGEWYIESVLRYNVDGEELTASTHSHGGASWEEPSMRRWADQHPPGTSLTIRYDPQHHDRIVLNRFAMPESEPHLPDDLEGVFLFFILAIACIIIGQRGKAKSV